MENKINEILHKEINPLLNEHYGSAELVEIKDNIVYIKMLGACGGCPCSQETLENIIEAKIREEIPEIGGVRLYQGVSDELINFAKDILNGKR
ncbi:MAG TPA: NifU family protein [Clostridiales bacterium]|nr:NifU family protein [Clostridiales bacterium]